jgi:phage tail protein X
VDNRKYITIHGDIWDGIALNQLGSEYRMSALMDLNREYLDIVVFPAGIELTLPEVAPEAPDTLPPWKQVI